MTENKVENPKQFTSSPNGTLTHIHAVSHVRAYCVNKNVIRLLYGKNRINKASVFKWFVWTPGRGSGDEWFFCGLHQSSLIVPDWSLPSCLDHLLSINNSICESPTMLASLYELPDWPVTWLQLAYVYTFNNNCRWKKRGHTTHSPFVMFYYCPHGPNYSKLDFEVCQISIKPLHQRHGCGSLISLCLLLLPSKAYRMTHEWLLNLYLFF